MKERLYEARTSKTIIILALILGIVPFFMFLALAIYTLGFLIGLYPSNGPFSAYLYLFCFCVICLAGIVMGDIGLIRERKAKIDVYMEDKFSRQHRKGKIYFEIEYKNIIEVKRGLITTSILCKESFRKTGWNKGATTLITYYDKRDFHYIRQIIVDKNPNVVFS